MTKPIALTVTAPPLVEVFVIDGRFRRVAAGVGGLTAQLSPGLYSVKSKVGGLSQERPLMVTPDQASMEIAAPDLVLREPIPTPTSGGPWAEARDQSRQPVETFGTGSSLFIFVWDEQARANARHPASSLRVRTAAGDDLIALDDLPARRSKGQPGAWCGAALDLAPGCYRLTGNTPHGGEWERTLVTSASWQTQLFLTRTSGDPHRGRWADLTDGALRMAPQTHGFEPDRPDLMWTEHARLGLQFGRLGVGRAALSLWMARSTEIDPMVGLMGAHQLARSLRETTARRTADRALVAEAAERLREVLGDHPDVRALCTSARATPAREVDVPPMLRASWECLVAASARDASVVRPDSLAAAVAPSVLHVWPWLVWTPPPAPASDVPRAGSVKAMPRAERPARSFQADDGDVFLASSSPLPDLGFLTRSGDDLLGDEPPRPRHREPAPASPRGRAVTTGALTRELRSKYPTPDALEDARERLSLDRAEEALLVYLTPMIHPRATRAQTRTEDPTSRVTIKTLTSDLAFPRSVVETALGGLAQKAMADTSAA